MFQTYEVPRQVRVRRAYLESAGTWLLHLALFAVLRWLAGLPLGEPSPAEQTEKPPAAAPADLLSDVKPPADPESPQPDSHVVPGEVLGDPEEIGCFRFTSRGMMAHPELLSGEKLQYTPEALAARVQGLMIVRCTITREGKVEKCRVLKSLPHMEQAAISALESRRYRPVMFQGRPLCVSYTFTIKLRLP